MRGITTKILTAIGGTFLVLLIITEVIITSFTRSNFVANETEILEKTNSSISAQVEGYFNRYITIIETMAADQNVEALLKSVKRGDSVERSAYFSKVFKMLEKSQALEADTILSTSMTDVDSGILMDSAGWVSGDDFDCTAREWYKAVTEKRVVITEPYEDAASGKQVVTIAAPVYDGKSTDVIGVSAVDIEITKMTNLVGQQVLGKTGFIILASPGGEVLSHRDPSMLLRDVSEIGLDDKMLQAVSAADGELVHFKNGKTDSVGTAIAVGDTGWRLISVLPEAEFMQKSNESQRILLFIYLFCAVLMAAALVVLAHVITKPIKGLDEMTQKLADGELDMEITVHTRDEVGNLANSLTRLTARLKEYIVYIDETSDVLNSFAGGDLTVELKNSYTGEFAKLKDAIGQISRIFNETIGEIARVSDQVNTGSEQVSSAAQSLSAATAQQAASVQELTATVQTISEQVKANATSAQNAGRTAEGVHAELDVSSRHMRELVEAMQRINDSSGEIGKIIKTIEDIAFQTNILALNAAVEAARAGAAGKGFAVVADEVRNLASKSAEAASNTAELIEASIQAVGQGTELSSMAEQSLQSVVRDMQSMVDEVIQISEATNQQAVSIEQVMQGMDQISSVVQTNSATAEESTAASQELFGQSQALHKLVGQFRLRDERQGGQI